MQWTTLSGTRNYNLLYDKLNRLIDADYSETIQQSGWTLSNDKYNLNNMTYDRNGNIKSLRRYGWTGSAFNMIDDLAYTYDGNQLLTVADASNNDLLYRGDFYEAAANGTGDGDEFDYDTNGNMTKDENNNQKFSYNILNLPDLMYYNTGSYPYIDYMYDATGTKRQEYYLYGPGNSKTIDYVGEFVYKKTGTAAGVLDFIITPEGRAKYNGSTFTYEYYLKDHLGNTAIVYKDSTGIAKVIQENSYYPFGLRMANTAVSNSTDNRYLYNGKELQSDFGFGWYDYGARFYDAAVGRFWTHDRFSEKYYSLSNYQYAANNPINFIDVNGDSLWISHRTGFLGLRRETLRYEDGNLYNKDGTAYTGKVNGFLAKTTNALGTISSCIEGASMISDLQSSDNNFSIVKASSSSFIADNPSKAYAMQIQTDPDQAGALAAFRTVEGSLSGGSGGTIYWSPSGTILPVVGGTARNGITDLAHEMTHAWDSDQGMLDNRVYDGIAREEWSAVYSENILRSRLGLPLRTHYIKTHDLSTGSITGTGTLMITNRNTPYLPLYPLTPKTAIVLPWK